MVALVTSGSVGLERELRASKSLHRINDALVAWEDLFVRGPKRKRHRNPRKEVGSED